MAIIAGIVLYLVFAWIFWAIIYGGTRDNDD